jgi:hypothetical protein
MLLPASRARARNRCLPEVAQTGTSLLPHHRVVAQHISDRRALRQQGQLLGRRAWNSRLYSTTGGHVPCPPTSEATVAQPLSQIVTRPRTTRRRLEHPSLYVMGLLHGLEPLGQPTGALAGAAQGQQEQKDREVVTP